MPNFRFPTLVWEDHSGCFTAKVAPYGDIAATASSKSEALKQIQNYLEWWYKQFPQAGSPDFEEPQLVQIRVRVRPEYTVGSRVYPCDEPLQLKIACVHGQREDGLRVAALPALGIYFDYYKQDSLKRLAVEAAQRTLHALSPAELAQFLPPKQLWLETVSVRVKSGSQAVVRGPQFPQLEAVAEPLGARPLQRQYARAWERDAVVADLKQRISQEKANVILVGESGVGKTTVLVETVRQLERAFSPRPGDEASAPRWRFWLTGGAQLIAGMQYLGQWEERLEAVIQELAENDGYLCVADLMELLRLGGSGPHDSLAAFLIPYLERSEVRLIGEATPSEIDACRRQLPRFVDLFQIQEVPELEPAAALTVLTKICGTEAARAKLEVERDVTSQLLRLFRRFLAYEPLPGKAAGFIGRLCERAAQEREPSLTADRAVAEFARYTGLPEIFLRDEIGVSLEEVQAEFRGQVIGQETACGQAARIITTFKAGLNDPQRPLGVLLFCGPTGVGKTQLAKTLARFLFAHSEESAEEDRLVRLDMSEFSGYGAGERLLTDAGGEPSPLITRVRQQPFTVVLLDEVEKAAPEVFDVLLGMFDEGRLTDRFGRTTFFRSAIIVMTSNLGAQKQDSIGFSSGDGPSYEREAMSFFRPEFFNRVDALVAFEPLSPQTVREITRKELEEIAHREGFRKASLRLTWTDQLVEQLAAEGYDARYGARPLQRTLESRVVAPLARYLLRHPGLSDCEVQLDLDQRGRLRIRH